MSGKQVLKMEKEGSLGPKFQQAVYEVFYKDLHPFALQEVLVKCLLSL